MFLNIKNNLILFHNTHLSLVPAVLPGKNKRRKKKPTRVPFIKKTKPLENGNHL